MAAVKQTPLTCSGHTRPVVDLAFSQITPHGYFVISACKDGKPMLRQGDTGDWIGTFDGHKGAVWGATLDKDASLAATGAADFSAKVWDAITGAEKHTFSHKHIVKSVCFSDDGKKLLTGSNEKILRIYDLEKPEADPIIFSGHTSHIKRAIFLKDGKHILSCSDDKTIRLWEIGTQEEVMQKMLPASAADVELSSDGQTLTIPYGHTVSFWNADKLEKQREYNLPSLIHSASLHPDKSIFIGGGEDFKMYKYDYTTGTEIESFKGHFGPVHCVRFSPDAELYASGSEDGTLRLWQTTVGKTYGLWRCLAPGEEGNNGIES